MSRHRLHPSIPTQLIEPVWKKETKLWSEEAQEVHPLEGKKLNQRWILWFHEMDDHRDVGRLLFRRKMGRAPKLLQPLHPQLLDQVDLGSFG